MAETGNRVEVRYGAFSCTIEGYDNPVDRMREVLALVQRMIAETPALADEDSGLDDDQFARLDRALAERRAGNGDQSGHWDDDEGRIVIRSGNRIAGDAEDAEILADATRREGEEQARWNRPEDEPSGDLGPHAAAAVFAAPAAAVAEAAFAASMTDAAGMGEDGGQEAPLGAELPEEAASPAALFAAPAADVAERTFAADDHVARPADPDDDAGEDLSADEAAAERVQTARMAAPGPAEETVSESFPADEDRRDETWTVDREHPSGAGGEPRSNPWTVPWGEAAAGSTDAEERADPLPRLNIFAPPPADLAAPEPEDERTRIIADRSPEPLASLRREPGAAAVEPTGGAPDHDGTESGESDEVLDDGAGDWLPDSEARGEGLEGEEAGSDGTGNRLAALITRYQGGGREAEEPAQHAGGAGISAAELAARAGATEVADLLAVSAAWLTLAGGRPQFNRRQVMEVFETLPGDHPRTLEARIKGFGKLVRSGSLVLVEDGAFAMPPRERERFRELIGQR